jgi:Na+-driven multidrug efflux pump
MAVQAITAQIELFTSMPGMAVGIGLVTVVGQCIGAGRPDEAVRYSKKLTLISFLCVAGFSALSIPACPLITRLAGMDADSARQVFRLIVLIACVKPAIWALGFTPAYGMRAAGDVRYSMIVSSVIMWIMRVALCWYLCRHAGFGVLGVWVAMFSDWACRAVLFSIRFASRKWLIHKVI